MRRYWSCDWWVRLSELWRACWNRRVGDDGHVWKKKSSKSGSNQEAKGKSPNWIGAQLKVKDLVRQRPSMWVQTYELGRVFGLDRIVRDLACSLWHHKALQSSKYHSTIFARWGNFTILIYNPWEKKKSTPEKIMALPCRIFFNRAGHQLNLCSMASHLICIATESLSAAAPPRSLLPFICIATNCWPTDHCNRPFETGALRSSQYLALLCPCT